MKKNFLLFFLLGIFIFSLVFVLYLAPIQSLIASIQDNYTPEPYESSDTFVALADEDVLGVQAGTIKIPVLMYHNIAAVPTKGSSSYRGLFVSPSMFEQQMKYLHDNGYKTLTPDEFYTYLKAGETPKRKTVLITFDDGSRGQYKYAYPVLKKYKMTATFYIIAERSPITKKELRDMSKNGMIIDSHTSTHKDLTKLKKASDFKYQLVTSKKTLEAITGKTIESIAYPGCVGYKQSSKIIESAGYEVAFSCGKSIYHSYKNRFNLSRIHVFSNMTSFKRALTIGL